MENHRLPFHVNDEVSGGVMQDTHAPTSLVVLPFTLKREGHTGAGILRGLERRGTGNCHGRAVGRWRRWERKNRGRGER